MRLFPRLWQRVFMYAILLVLLAHLVGVLVFRLLIEKNLDLRIVNEVSVNEAASLEGKYRGAIRGFSDFLGNSQFVQWLEEPDGTLIAGAPPEPAFTHAGRHALPVVASHFADITIFESGRPDAPYVVEIPVLLSDGQAMLCLNIKKPKGPLLPDVFLQSLIAVGVIGGTFSVWAAWRIARPLRRMREEVSKIADGDLEARVSENGPEEIVQVARAVNNMAWRLSRTITGMRELLSNISHEVRSPWPE